MLFQGASCYDQNLKKSCVMVLGSFFATHKEWVHASPVCLDLTPSAENIGWQPDEKAPYQWIAMDIHPGHIYKI